MDAPELEEIVAEHIDMDGNKLVDPKLQPGRHIAYEENGITKEYFVIRVLLHWKTWKITVQDSLTKELKIIPPNSTFLSLSSELKTDINQGEEYQVNILYRDGTIRPSVAVSVLTQSQLGENSDTYLRTKDLGEICSVKTAYLKRAKSFQKTPM